MKIYTIHEKQLLPISLDRAWSFFSNPCNLAELTPPAMHMRIIKVPPGTIYSGMQITYKMAPLFHIPLTWKAEIRNVQEGRQFIDRQVKGPYKYWQHHHLFTPVNSGIIVEDLLHYALPFGPAGAAAHTFFIHKKLADVFKFRRSRLEQLFG